MTCDISQLKKEVKEILTLNILPYWMKYMQDDVNGGFRSGIDGNEQYLTNAPKGVIMNARILWTFSSAYRLLKDESYLQMATRAKRAIIDQFYDHEHGGVYWSVDEAGNPLDTKKQIYALGFAIYGLSEYFRATADEEALKYAIALFEDIENHSFDNTRNGYFEAFTRNWMPIEDMRLSDKDMNVSKTMNTHLHILEPYTNLYKVWQDPRLEKQLRNLIRLFTYRFFNIKTHHLSLFFDDYWNRNSEMISFGHDIEASWLLHEAALAINDQALINQVVPFTKLIAKAATEGLIPQSGMIYEIDPLESKIDGDRHWWVQAEAIVGYLNLYQHFDDKRALKKAVDCWDFSKKHLIDYANGEWYWSVRANGLINRKEDKAGFWKCPYHNGRMCMEVLERF